MVSHGGQNCRADDNDDNEEEEEEQRKREKEDCQETRQNGIAQKPNEKLKNKKTMETGLCFFI